MAEKKTTVKKAEPKKEKTVIVTVPLLNVRQDASLNSPVVAVVERGDQLVIKTEKDGFGNIGKGWVKLEFTQEA